MDVAQRINKDAVVFLDRFAVWIAGMIDPAGIVAPNFWIYYVAVVQTEVESVWIVFVVGSGFPGDAFTCVFNDTRPFWNELTGVNTPTVHVGFANLELHRTPPSFGFLSHAQSWNYFWFFTRACSGIDPIPQRRRLQKEQTFRTLAFKMAGRVRTPENVTMKLKQSIPLVLALCLIASSVLANLGANSEVIEDAYGTIVQRRLRDDGKVSVVYTKGRYLYMVTFADSRSVTESYSRANGTDLSEKEITKFLKANSRAKWLPLNSGTERHFKTSDGSAEATYGILNGRPALTVRAVNP
jgi:hypothetical protein